jgi:hypothetical protein
MESMGQPGRLQRYAQAASVNPWPQFEEAHTMLKKARYWAYFAALVGGSLFGSGCPVLSYWQNPWARGILLWLNEDLLG